MRVKNVIILVPAFNEAGNIERVINNLEEVCQKKEIYKNMLFLFDYIVIDDFSDDSTLEICKNFGARTLNLCCNLGIGGAVQTGLMYAKEYNYDYAIQFDGDGQHNHKEIPKMLKQMIDMNADMVIGSRFLTKSKEFQSTFFRKVGICYFSKLIYFLTGKLITDPTSGFRIINKSTIKLFSELYPEDYPEPEVLVMLIKRNKRIFEIPVVMVSRVFGKSSIRYFRTIYYMIKVSLAILIGGLKYRRN